jgi:hypothetical protein
MAILSKQIGWSQESNLLWEILNKLNRLAGVVSTAGNVQPVTEVNMSVEDYTITSMGIYQLNDADGNYNLTLPDPTLFKGQRLVLINTSTSNNVDFTGVVYSGAGTLSSISPEQIFELVSVGDKWRVINSVNAI